MDQSSPALSESEINDDENPLVEHARKSVDETIDATPIGYFHRRTVFILGIGNVADAVEVLAIGYILTIYEAEEGQLSSWESSSLAASAFLGMLFGGLTSGVCSDKFGRRPLLMLHLLINGCSGIAAAWSPTVWWLILFRFGSGFGVGGTVTTLFALCVEHLPTKTRGFYVTLLCSFWMVGSILTAATAWIMLGKHPNGDRIWDVSWRYFALVVALPSWICLLLVYVYIPESARFLASQHRYTEADKVLQYIHEVNNYSTTSLVLPPSANTSSPLIPPSEDLNYTPSFWNRKEVRIIQSLYRYPLLATTTCLMVTSYCQSFGSYGLATWITKVYQTIGFSNPFANAFLYALANLPGNVFSAIFIDRIGRHQLLAMSMSIASLAALGFAYWANVPSPSPTAVVILSCAFNAAATSAWNAYGVLSAEAFPTASRGSAMSILNGIGRLGAIGAQFVNGFLVGHISILLLVTSVVMLLGAYAAMRLLTLSRDLILKNDPSRSIQV